MLGKGDLDAVFLQIAQPDTDRENIHLAAGIVDIIFAVDIKTDRAHQRSHGSAVSSTTTVTDVQRAGGIGGDKFELDFFTLADFGAAKAFALFQNLADDIECGIAGQVKIDKARTGNFGFCHGFIRRQGGDNFFGQRARRHARRFGQRHRDVAGEITMAEITAAGDHDRRRDFAAEHAFVL